MSLTLRWFSTWPRRARERKFLAILENLPGRKGVIPTVGGHAGLHSRGSVHLARRADKLSDLRDLGESCSEVILRLAAVGRESLNRS
jgi:hypothetical protein